MGAPSDGDTPPDQPFDPYRFGAPDVPPPPEYAPPGYTPPPGYLYPPAAAEGAHGPYPPYPYGTTAGPSAPPYGPPQQPYGQPAYGPSYDAGPAPAQSNGKAVAALVLGIVSVVLSWTTFLDALFVILALIFGFLGLNDARSRSGQGRGQALAGLICAAIGAVLAIGFTVFVVHLANKCGGIDNQGSPGYQQCLRDHI